MAEVINAFLAVNSLEGSEKVKEVLKKYIT